MNLTQQQLDRLAQGLPVQVVLLKKEDETGECNCLSNDFEELVSQKLRDKLIFGNAFITTKELNKLKQKVSMADFPIICIKTAKGRRKFQIGRDYSTGAWYCRQCKKVKPYNNHTLTTFGVPICNSCEPKDIWTKRVNFDNVLIPLRFRVDSIRSAKLLDLTKEDAKKGRYKNRFYLYEAFYKANKNFNDKSKEMARNYHANWDMTGAFIWNPEVWVIDFCVVK